MQVDLLDLLDGLKTEFDSRNENMKATVIEGAGETIGIQHETIVAMLGLINFYAEEHERKFHAAPTDDPAARETRYEKFKRNALVIERVLDLCPWIEREEFENFELEAYDRSIGLNKENLHVEK